MTKHLHLKKVLAAVLTIAALATGQQAFATITETFTFKGNVQTVNNTNYYNFEVGTSGGFIGQLSSRPGTYHQFNSIHYSWNSYNVTLNGTLQFQVSNTLTDVVVQGSTFTVTFESQSLWFYGASVKKLNGTSVTNSSVTVSSDKHTVTVTINGNGTEFGQIILNYVPNEPFNNNNTVIGGIATEYDYTGRPIEPVPTVTYKGTLLTEGTDYTLSYTNTMGPGSAWVTITGIGQYAGSFNHYYNIRAIALSDFTNLGNNTYQIATTTDLDHLAGYVKLNNDCQGLTFKQTADIAYTYTTAWDDSGNETNFTAIGGWGRFFKGTFDGQNHTISGIRISKVGTTDSDKCQGLFGVVDNGGTVRNVVLADTRIKGYTGTGGIVGVNSGTIEDCRVQNNVLVRSSGKPYGNHGSDFGGIAGSNENGGTVTRCTSSVTIDGFVGNGSANPLDPQPIYSVCLGAIVGQNRGTVSNCLALNANVTGDSFAAAIVGRNNSGYEMTANYYRGCTVTNKNHSNGSSIGVGVGTTNGSEDQDGARSVHALTLGTDITATGESVVIDGITYYASNTTVTLGYDNLPAGQMPVYSVGSNTLEGNTFTMPAANRTVTVTLIDAWTGSGTQGDPYVITTTAQLDALASAVKGGTTYSGTYFILGNDIAYSTAGLGDTDENFTTIGGYFNGDKNFSGNFNGQGYTISGIRLYKNGTAAPSMNQGLFGRIDGATIRNVILADARITGYRYVGGLVGNKVSGTVQNCLVLESTITCADKYVGALFGKNTGTITANYYHNCTVNGTNNATNVGVGGNGGTSSSSDKNGARSAHTLTLGENVTATGESVTYQGTTYYASNTTVTLGYNNLPAGYEVTYTLNGISLSGNTFTMPANDNAVVSATVTAPTYTKAIAAHHTENGVNYGWYLIASPVGTVNLTDVPHLFDNQYDLYYFDQTGGDNGKEWKNHKAHTNTFTTLESGIGYLYANSGNVTLEFTGEPYSGNGQVTLTKADGFEFSGWNLIGNPLGTAATLDKPFYRMNESGSALSAQIEANNSVAAMEGVFVQASTNNETATFTQVNNSKGGEKDAVPMLTLNLTRNRGEAIDNAIVRFDGGHTLEKFSFREGSTKIYIPQDGTDYAIATSNGQGEMPVNFKATENGTYTLTISTTLNSQLSTLNYLHLIDNMTGADVDLLTPEPVEGPATYTFTAKTTDYASRFKLVFSANGNADGDNDAFAFIDASGNIIVNGEGTLQVMDVMGRIIVSHGGHTRCVPTTGLTAGVYVLRLIDGENVKTLKIVIS